MQKPGAEEQVRECMRLRSGRQLSLDGPKIKTEIERRRCTSEVLDKFNLIERADEKDNAVFRDADITITERAADADEVFGDADQTIIERADEGDEVFEEASETIIGQADEESGRDHRESGPGSSKNVSTNYCNISKEIVKTQIMTFNLNTAFQFIPDFNGEANSNLNRFLHCCDAMYTLAQTEQEQITFIHILHSKVTGKAYQVLEQNPSLKYPELKKEFVKQFDKTDSYEALLFKILNTKQNSMNTLDYSNKLEQMLLDLNTVCGNLLGTKKAEPVRILNERVVKKGFEEGLKPGLKLLVKARAFETLREATLFAIEEDRQFLSATQRSTHTYSPNVRNWNNNHGQDIAVKEEQKSQFQISFCKFCKMKGHVEKNCYKRQNGGNSGNGSGQNPFGKGSSASRLN